MVANGTDAIPHGGCLCSYVCIFIFLTRTRIGGQGSYGPELANNPEVRARYSPLQLDLLGWHALSSMGMLLAGKPSHILLRIHDVIARRTKHHFKLWFALAINATRLYVLKKKGLRNLTKDLLFGVELCHPTVLC